LSVGEASDEELARAASLPCRRRDAAWREGGRASRGAERERERETETESGEKKAGDFRADVLCWAHLVLG